MNYSICNLYSGSRGNSTLISACGKNILIDAGKSAKTLCEALNSIGKRPEDIDAIFITHEHTDHVSALQTFSHKYDAPIHILLSSAKKKFYGLRDQKLFDKMVFHESPSFCADIGDIHISSFPTPHDSFGSVGYTITIKDTDIKIGYATDIGHITNEIRYNLLGCESVVIESNHDIDMLRTGPYPEDLKRRIASDRGHLSNSDCSLFCTELVRSGTKRIMLAHLSEENNIPSLAYDSCIKAINNTDIFVCAASPTTPVWLIGG